MDESVKVKPSVVRVAGSLVGIVIVWYGLSAAEEHFQKAYASQIRTRKSE